jgi:14-3-3 protein epsilon
MSPERELSLYNAKLAEQAERFDEMAEWVSRCAAAASAAPDSAARQLSIEERSLISVAFKNAVGARRASWRVIKAVEEDEKSILSENTAALVVKYRGQVESEITLLCGRILTLLDTQLIPACAASEAKVGFLKMRGDYHRYLAEIADAPGRGQAAQEAAAAYAEAASLAETALPVSHPARLALALNRSVFLFEISQTQEQACIVARQAFEAATAQIEREQLSAGSLKESAMILQLLRDNLTLWTS